MKEHIFLTTAVALLITSCSPDSDSTGSNSQYGLNLPGTLYYDSAWGKGFVSYNFKTTAETLIKHQNDFSMMSVSPDSRYLSFADGDYLLNIIDTEDSSQSFLIDHWTDLTYDFEDETVFSPNNYYFMQTESLSTNQRLTIRHGQDLITSISDDDLYDLTGEEFDNYAWYDNQSVIFASGTYMFYIEDVTTGSYKLLKNFSPYAVGHLSVSRDGSKIAFTKTLSNSGGNYLGDVYYIDVDSSEEHQLTTNSELRSLAWSPNGKYIAAVAGKWYADGSQLGGGFKPSIHIIPADISEPVYIVYGTESASDKVMTLKTTNFDGNIDNVWLSANHIYWNP